MGRMGVSRGELVSVLNFGAAGEGRGAIGRGGEMDGEARNDSTIAGGADVGRTRAAANVASGDSVAGEGDRAKSLPS